MYVIYYITCKERLWMRVTYVSTSYVHSHANAHKRREAIEYEGFARLGPARIAVCPAVLSASRAVSQQHRPRGHSRPRALAKVLAASKRQGKLLLHWERNRHRRTSTAAGPREDSFTESPKQRRNKCTYSQTYCILPQKTQFSLLFYGVLRKLQSTTTYKFLVNLCLDKQNS